MNLLVHQRQERLICFDCNVSNNIAALINSWMQLGEREEKL